MTSFGYFMKKLKRLGLNLKTTLAYELVLNHSTDLHRYRYLMLNNQIGGVKQPIKIEFVFKNYPFVFYKDEDRYTVSYTIHINENQNKSECVFLQVEKEERFVYINNISKYEKCSRIGMPKSKGGVLLLEMTLNFIIKVLKPKYDLKYIMLKDNSEYYCEKSGSSLDFDSFYMLTHGETWYGSYGFRPFDMKIGDIDKDRLKKYKMNQKLVETKLKDANIKDILKSVIKNKIIVDK
jgi:hypothetical protein